MGRVDESWERLSVSCLVATSGIVRRDAETGLSEALRQPGLLGRVGTPEGRTAGGPPSSGWPRLGEMGMGLAVVLASNVVSFIVGMWLGRRQHYRLAGVARD